jgi:hypothetical protein
MATDGRGGRSPSGTTRKSPHVLLGRQFTTQQTSLAITRAGTPLTLRLVSPGQVTRFHVRNARARRGADRLHGCVRLTSWTVWGLSRREAFSSSSRLEPADYPLATTDPRL